jgi:thiol:disulfide interchange protein DsbD
MLGTAVWFAGRILPQTWMVALWGAWLVAMAVTLFYFARRAIDTHLPAASAGMAASLLVGLWGGLMVVGAAAGAQDPLRPLSVLTTANTAASGGGAEAFMDRFEPAADRQALIAKVDAADQAGQWTLVDFYADWCVACKVIEREVFGNPEVQRALADFQLLRPDVTDYNKADRRLMSHYNVYGPPTILLIGPDGRERRAARIVGELDAEAFLKHLHKAREAS